MTLILTLVRPEGIWQSSDHRVTMNGQPAPLTDAAAKQLAVQFSIGNSNLPLMLMGFTGIANVAGLPTIKWLAETIRGEVWTRVLDCLKHVTVRAEHDIANRGPLILHAALIDAEATYFATIHNLDDAGRTTARFNGQLTEITAPAVFAGGSGAYRLSENDKTQVLAQLQLRPNSWEDHAGLLAGLNRRIASRDETVSNHCTVTFRARDREGVVTRGFNNKGRSVETRRSPFIMCGIDLTELSLFDVDRGDYSSDDDPTVLDAMTDRAIRPRP